VPDRPRRTRLASLDGLRAVAVGAVVLYHADSRLLPGGFVGVDVFFALSGYLITALLLAERDGPGPVSLAGFWRRRVRRLWPLAWLALAAVAVAGLTGVWGADREALLPGETVAALANVANWWQAAHGGYVESFVAPSPLRHFWSLSVEEQFYLLWPLLLLGLLALGARVERRHRGTDRSAGPTATRTSTAVAAAGTAVLFVASAVSAWFADPATAYLATHTRAVALLAGALLALGLRHRPLAGPSGTPARRAFAAWGLLGAVALGAAAAVATPEVAWLHRGGFAAVAVASTGVVALALVPGRTARLLSAAPLVWVGHRSYAVYLVHWPLIVAMGPGRPTWLVLAVVVPTTLALSALLHRVVERPVLAGAWTARRLTAAGAVLLVVGGAALAVGQGSGPTPREEVAATLGRVEDPTAAAPAPETPPPGQDQPGATTTTAPCVPATAPPPAFGDGDGDGFDPATVGEVADPSTTCAGQVRVLVVGDSLGRGASNGLVALADPRLQVWDRTELGCSFGPERCGDWRGAWAEAVAAVDPDVVLVFSGIKPDLHGVEDAGFLSAEGDAQRVAAWSDAGRIPGATGARVAFVNSAVPGRPNGLFYCDGRATSSPCDPRWVAAWNDSLARAAADTGAVVVDAGGWVAARSATDRTDRPDGAHLSGPALREFATWLVPQVLATAADG
jgi:peptidoglycan/LPS O-acetylase OafA/YrhL